ncbi:sialate O-acetylesterase [Pedobacter sp. HMF7647]|uniref:Sialate O-acetylesterase n=1 Tax=Hufsiella arboris TaxID=2695275 RepID=A0A7K1YBU6_9SPHI|nr:sialate O-acetylesterase [Hufsiella arboris]MXV51841.1 sialate O-acetylesterase [Hufsiella arboris]
MKKLKYLYFLWFTIGCFSLQAQIKLPGIIRDSMILQRDQKIKVWGWASPAEKVTLDFKGKRYSANTSTDGKWQLTLPAVKASGPYTMKFSGKKNTILLSNILFGDMWLFSGQSNMVHQMNIHDITYANDIKEANYPQIRQFLIPTLTNMQGPAEDLQGKWQVAVGDQVRPFTAVGFFFARKVYEQTKVPIGIINASVGGTPIEAWISETGLKDFQNIEKTIERNRDISLQKKSQRPASNPVITPPVDAGMSAALKWFDPAYQPRGWHRINIPGYWEDQGVKDLNGIVWYRREIAIPKSMTGKPAKVFLGRIVDADELYINGAKVGNTTYLYPQRRYPVPADLLKEGKNLFVIRVTNNSGKGGFVPDKPYCIFAGQDTVDLKGYWDYKVGLVNRPFAGSLGDGINVQNQPSALYNAMIAPVTRYAIKGAAWYQGEANANQPELYDKLLPALIKDWRNQYQDQNLPFFYVQLPGFMDYNYLPSESQWARLREAQLKALSIPQTAMAVAIDAGEWNDIHPDNKKAVGERLALAALVKVYGKKIEYSGPVFQYAQVKDNQIILSFDHIGSGLISNDGEALSEFAIAGADKKFVWAKAKIEGEKVIVWSDEIKQPLYVRYAWADNPVNPNLYNKEGLPASPFRTDK